MKLKFLAGAGPLSYEIKGNVINGVDVSLFTEGSIFTGDSETEAAGIFNVQRVDGQLHVTLGQMTKAYQITVASHDWRESDWIDADDYDPAKCYVVAVRPKAQFLLESGQAEYARDPETGAWTVRMIDAPEQEPTQ